MNIDAAMVSTTQTADNSCSSVEPLDEQNPTLDEDFSAFFAAQLSCLPDAEETASTPEQSAALAELPTIISEVTTDETTSDQQKSADELATEDTIASSMPVMLVMALDKSVTNKTETTPIKPATIADSPTAGNSISVTSPPTANHLSTNTAQINQSSDQEALVQSLETGTVETPAAPTALSASEPLSSDPPQITIENAPLVAQHEVVFSPVASSPLPVDPQPVSVHLSLPVAEPSWGQALSEQVVLFTQAKVNAAEIHLNPPDLGPLDIKLKLSENQASIDFHCHHPVVRETVATSLPKLRDLLHEQGIQLQHADVSDRADRQPGHSSHLPKPAYPALSADHEVEMTETVSVAPSPMRAMGLIDYFA